MDPEANYAEQLEIARRIMKDWDEGEKDIDNALLRLAELILSLDEWVKKGGSR